MLLIQIPYKMKYLYTRYTVGRWVVFLTPSQPFRLYQGDTINLITSQSLLLLIVPDISQSLLGEVSENMKQDEPEIREAVSKALLCKAIIIFLLQG